MGLPYLSSMYKNFSHLQVDKLLANRLRLAILASVSHSDEVDFTSLRQAVKTTDGNLSVQLGLLQDAGWIIVKKLAEGNRPQTIVALTNKGRTAIDAYRNLIDGWFAND
jgi:DNA-binding transcriptional ArsR family regulator